MTTTSIPVPAAAPPRECQGPASFSAAVRNAAPAAPQPGEDAPDQMFGDFRTAA